MDALLLAAQFVEAINLHDVDRVVSLLSPDHRFIDSLGNVVEGRDALRRGWAFYFGMVPDYKFTINGRFLTAGETGAEVVFTGVVEGSYCFEGTMRPNSAWSTPVAVRAKVAGSLLTEWQVYADNEPIREQMHAAAG